MSKFKVGDVCSTIAFDHITITGVGSPGYYYGEQAVTNKWPNGYGDGCWSEDDLTLIQAADTEEGVEEPVVLDTQAEYITTAQDDDAFLHYIDEASELEKLRQFKADALARYPELGMSEQDRFMIDCRTEWYGGNNKAPIDPEGELAQLMLKCITWGREHG